MALLCHCNAFILIKRLNLMKKMLVYSGLIGLLLINSLLNAQIVIDWQKNYGGSGIDELTVLQQTADEGYILGGSSLSFGIDRGKDFWVIKTDAQGEIEWEENYGGFDLDILSGIVQMDDGGFVFGGTTESTDGDINENNGASDYWIVKVSMSGIIEWTQNYGGNGLEFMTTLQQTSDGGFILGGTSYSDNAGDNGEGDYWAVKINSEGDVEWEQNYGGSSFDELHSIAQLTDGGYLLGGWTKSNDLDVSMNNGGSDYWVVKVNSLGEIEWEKSYGGFESEYLRTVHQTIDGGFLLGGAAADGFSNDDDFLVFKTDFEGNVEWERTYGGSSAEYIEVIKETSESGFIFGGSSKSSSGDVSSNFGGYDYWLVLTNSDGEIEWEQNYGSDDDDLLSAAQQTSDGGFILGGTINSSGGDVGANNGEKDFWIVKIRNIDKKINAYSYYDTNQNGQWDGDEQPLFNQSFILTPEAVAGISSNSGFSTFYVDPGTYTLQYANNQVLWQLGNSVDSYTIEIGDFVIDTSFYFPLTPTGDFLVQQTDISSSITRCNRETNYWLTYSNIGTTVNSGFVRLMPDETTNFISANPAPDSTSNDTLYWFYEDLHPTHTAQINLVYKMPSFIFIGEDINFEAEIETWDGLGGHKSFHNSELICAYDPNDKLAEPYGHGEDNYTLFEDTLNYTIRFQNTGNDTAFNIIIRDTINEHLNLDGFEFLAASHSVKSNIKLDERIVEFSFEDIYLPDSNVNELASHGFVKFAIHGNDLLSENTDIENSAGICFDFNPAIITNQVSNRMVSVLPSLPVLAATPNDLDFGEMPMDAALYSPQILKIQNYGDLSLHLNEFEFEDNNFYCEISDLSIEGQNSQDVEIRFSPSQIGEHQSVLKLKSNAGDVMINLRGTATAATGLGSLSQSKFSIFPNPSNGQFFINCEMPNADYKVKIQNSEGKVIKESLETASSLVIDLRGQSAGVYFITIETDEELSREKVILIR